MDLGLKNKVTLVMAASKGLGRATAQVFAEEGATVVISSRNEAELNKTAEKLRTDTGAEIWAVPADASKLDDLEHLIQSTMQKYGRIDALVSNAGGPPSGTFMQHDEQTWANAINLIVMRAVRSVRLVVPIMKAQGGGSITFIESASVKNALDGLILSNSLRMAVVGLTKSLAHELGPDNIRVNVVCPGMTATDRILDLAGPSAQKKGISIEEELKQRGQAIPLRRVAEPIEFGRACAFMASPAASYISGTILMVDGGLSRGI